MCDRTIKIIFSLGSDPFIHDVSVGLCHPTLHEKATDPWISQWQHGTQTHICNNPTMCEQHQPSPSAESIPLAMRLTHYKWLLPVTWQTLLHKRQSSEMNFTLALPTENYDLLIQSLVKQKVEPQVEFRCTIAKPWEYLYLHSPGNPNKDIRIIILRDSALSRSTEWLTYRSHITESWGQITII